MSKIIDLNVDKNINKNINKSIDNGVEKPKAKRGRPKKEKTPSMEQSKPVKPRTRRKADKTTVPNDLSGQNEAEIAKKQMKSDLIHNVCRNVMNRLEWLRTKIMELPMNGDKSGMRSQMLLGNKTVSTNLYKL